VATADRQHADRRQPSHSATPSTLGFDEVNLDLDAVEAVDRPRLNPQPDGGTRLLGRALAGGGPPGDVWRHAPAT